MNAPAAFIHPCQPIVAKQPPSGPGWVHELKHDGYRLQIHVKDGRVRLIQSTAQTGPSATPLIVRDAGRIEGSAIVDAEVVWLDSEGMAVFDALHSRVYDAKASACAFDLLMLNGEDIRRRPYVERKAALRKILRHDKLLAAACKLGLEGIVSKKLDAPYKSGPSEAWLKIKNPNAPAATPIAKIGTKQIVRRATKRMAASRM